MAKRNLTFDGTVSKYERYIYVIREDLRQIDLNIQNINAEISDMIQQKHTLKVVCDPKIHPDGFKAQVDLGCLFFMEASVPDTSKLLFNIGLNHYVELTPQEANLYLDARISSYERKAAALREQSVQGKATIKLMLFVIGELYDRLQTKG